jgi:spore maturation protein CgeB
MRGRRNGYRDGWQDGYWLGQSERTIRLADSGTKPVRPVHVMYVPTGKGYPYSPLDEAVAATLGTLVTRLTIADRHDHVAALAAELRPDVVLVLDGIHFDPAQADAVRALGIRIAIWFTDDPYYTDVTASLALHYDDVFTLERRCVEFYQQAGCQRVHHLPLGVYPKHYRPMNASSPKRKEISFVGSAYWNRVVVFDQITPYLAERNTHISGIWWDRLPGYQQLAARIEVGKWMEPAETAETYSGAAIVINLHRATDDSTFNSNSRGIGAVSPNPRTFEIAACATLQLTDIREDLAAYYTPGAEIETYASAEELKEKLDYYLRHEEERRAIAQRGLLRTMREHTYAHRLHAMLGMLFD